MAAWGRTGSVPVLAPGGRAWREWRQAAVAAEEPCAEGRVALPSLCRWPRADEAAGAWGAPPGTLVLRLRPIEARRPHRNHSWPRFVPMVLRWRLTAATVSPESLGPATLPCWESTSVSAVPGRTAARALLPPPRGFVGPLGQRRRRSSWSGSSCPRPLSQARS